MKNLNALNAAFEKVIAVMDVGEISSTKWLSSLMVRSLLAAQLHSDLDSSPVPGRDLMAPTTDQLPNIMAFINVATVEKLSVNSLVRHILGQAVAGLCGGTAMPRARRLYQEGENLLEHP